MAATAHAYGDFFPGGQPRPGAQPCLAEDLGGRAGFEAELAKFQATAAAAVEAAGQGGPGRQGAFAAAVKPIFGNCKSCHESYRTKN